MKLKLTIELEGVSFDVEAFFYNDCVDTYLEDAYPCDNCNAEIMEVWAEASEKDTSAAVWAAYDAYVKESNEP